MSGEIDTKENLNLMYFFMHPTRQKIIRALLEANMPLYVPDIVKKIGEREKLIEWHLKRMESFGLVDADYRVVAEPNGELKRGKFYWTTPEVNRAYDITRMLLDLLLSPKQII
jgi:predicted transcriptional regulator